MKRMYAILFAILVAYGAVWGISWRQPIVISFSGFVDTLVFGVDPAASWHYDPGIDEVIPFVPPSGPHAFFRLNDPANPFITMLSVDIRRDARVRHIFKGFVGGDIGRARISWDPATIPAGQIRIGIGTETTEPTRWYDMHYNDHLEFDAPDWFWISCRPYSSGADHPPYLAFAYPQDGRRDVPPSAPVVVVLDDDETGVNVHSMQMFVNGVDVTSSIEKRRLLSGIQVIYRHPPFEYDSLMNIRVIAADIASFPHYLDTTFSFRTSIPAFSPQWELPLFFVNITARDTVTKCIYAAGAEGASQFFDSLDVAFPSFPAPEFEVFFKLSDPAYPFITALSRDTRPLDSDNLWVVDFQNSGTALFASWIKGGYGWLFPKLNLANLGVGGYNANPKLLMKVAERLGYFLGIDKFKPIEIMGGLLPIGGVREKISFDRVLLVGDAAGFTDPVTGAGIASAWETGALAAKAAYDFIKNGVPLKSYDELTRPLARAVEKSRERRLSSEEKIRESGDIKSAVRLAWRIR